MKTVMRTLHIFLEAILGIIVFSLPFVVGQVFRSKSVSFTYLCGQLLLWAAFQLIAVPMVFYRAEFSTLFWAYTGVVVVLTAVGAFMMLKNRHTTTTDAGTARKRRRPWWKRLSPFLIIAFLIIGYQMFIYIFGMHLDKDDARWIAEANDALVKNKMLLYNPATGEYIGRFVGEMVKDVFSPWSMYLAWLGRATGIRAVVIAHTVYPPILLGLSYSAYYEIGTQLFADEKENGKRKSKKHERAIFLLMVSVINLFMAGNVYTQSVFTLTRIWQGKAVVAAVMIPTVLMVILRIQEPSDFRGQERQRPKRTLDESKVVRLDDYKWYANYERKILDWIILIVSGFSCCLFSGMGIAIGLLMILVYGAYVVVRELVKDWRVGLLIVPFWVLSMTPSIVYGVGYIWLRG